MRKAVYRYVYDIFRFIFFLPELSGRFDNYASYFEGSALAKQTDERSTEPFSNNFVTNGSFFQSSLIALKRFARSANE